MANQITTNFDNTNIFVFDNRFTDGTYTASGAVDLLQGTLMGRVSATQKLVPLESTASNGSQYPVGILTQDYIIESAGDIVLSVCVSGDVVEDKVILAYGDTLSTVISGRSIRDRIAADTIGIKLVGSDQMTAYDNQ